MSLEQEPELGPGLPEVDIDDGWEALSQGLQECLGADYYESLRQNNPALAVQIELFALDVEDEEAQNRRRRATTAVCGLLARQMDGGLPTVREEVFVSAERDLLEVGASGVDFVYLNWLNRKDFIIADVVACFAAEADSPKERSAIHREAAFLYRAIESQTEANYMNRMFLPGEDVALGTQNVGDVLGSPSSTTRASTPAEREHETEPGAQIDPDTEENTNQRQTD